MQHSSVALVVFTRAQAFLTLDEQANFLLSNKRLYIDTAFKDCIQQIREECVSLVILENVHVRHPLAYEHAHS